MDKLIIEEALPVAELSRLGLYNGSNYLLSNDDLMALLSGRRTSMINLNNLVSDDFVIDSLDAKLSLSMDQHRVHEIRIHPIYKEPQHSKDLDPHEINSLVAKEIQNVAKLIKFADGETRPIVFEYDSETREFISYNPEMVRVPSQINGEKLNTKQQEEFAYGKTVNLSDGTEIQYRASEPKGIISDRTALIIGMFDKGILESFLVKGLSSILGVDVQKSPFSQSFESAYIDMEREQGTITDGVSEQNELENFKTQYNRGYGLGISR